MVRRQEIPKSGGGVRQLGIPTVLDRFIQQAILQVLQPIFDPTFSEHSYGFRPGRRAHDAVCQAQRYIQSGRRWVVDVDLEKFFDRVNHDVLMSRLEKRIGDRRLLRVIRRYLGPEYWPTAWWWSGTRGRRRAAPSRRCWRTCSWTRSTGSWREAGTPSYATPMIATCTCGRGGRTSV
ncbi:MAG TPA: reverse transcriptase domain-containing protein [Longimicrobium sp.]